MKKLRILVILCFLLTIAGASFAGDEDLLPVKETGGLKFQKYEIGDMIVYYHQRKIGEAIVEKDYMVYQYDKRTKKLLKKIVKWRKDLPEHLPPQMITKEKAESMVEGKVHFASLYFISPDSDVFPLKETPKNPCWVVRSEDDKGNRVVTIIDAVEGVILGNGIPPPYSAFSLSGPTAEGPCSSSWSSHFHNAESWFNTMGYTTEAVLWPPQDKIRSHIQSTETAMFYEIGHSQHTMGVLFTSGCVGGSSYETVTATEVDSWISCYAKMPFTFIASCYGMCETDPGTLSHAFRKGSLADTATVGYCGMADPPCYTCWSYALPWQDALFDYMNQEWTVMAAFFQATADYPMCFDCVRFVGDGTFSVVPVVERGPMSFMCFLDKILEEFLEYRRVFPPDPVIKIFLDRAEEALRKASAEVAEEEDLSSLDSIRTAVRFIEKAGKEVKVDTTEFIDILINGVSQKVKADILDVESMTGSANKRIQYVWKKYRLASKLYEKGKYDAAMRLFKNVYKHVMKLKIDQQEVGVRS